MQGTCPSDTGPALGKDEWSHQHPELLHRRGQLIGQECAADRLGSLLRVRLPKPIKQVPVVLEVCLGVVSC